MTHFRNIISVTLILVFFLAKNSFAGASLIRDAEIERFLHNLSDPIFKAAGLDPKNITIYIVNDDSINAFVSGGQNIFINTGLIRKYITPDALIGVIAHETGHIVGGHLARSAEGMEQATGAMLLSYLLGLGAIVAGSPDAGQALIIGGSQTSQRLFMRFTRTQEEAADQYAIKFLDKISYPADGLVRLLEFFESQMIGYKGQIDEYLLSHPISQKRIDLIKSRTAGKDFSDKKINRNLQSSMNWVLAKLEGFMDNPDYLLKKYKNSDAEFATYIKSIALFKKGKIDESIKLLDEVIAKESKNGSENGFLFELKGQILFESGHIEDSIIAYNKSINLLDKNYSAKYSSLAKISFATALLSLKENDPDLIKLAIKKLKEAQKFESDNPFVFRQLGSGYSKIGDKGRSSLALAEFYLITGDDEQCIDYATKAREILADDKSSSAIELLHADDLLNSARINTKK